MIEHGCLRFVQETSRGAERGKLGENCYAASRYCRGDAPNSARNVRVKFDRSSNPTSSAILVTGVFVAASFSAAARKRARKSHWCGVTPVTILKLRRK